MRNLCGKNSSIVPHPPLYKQAYSAFFPTTCLRIPPIFRSFSAGLAHFVPLILRRSCLEGMHGVRAYVPLRHHLEELVQLDGPVSVLVYLLDHLLKLGGRGMLPFKVESGEGGDGSQRKQTNAREKPQKVVFSFCQVSEPKTFLVIYFKTPCSVYVYAALQYVTRPACDFFQPYANLCCHPHLGESSQFPTPV